MDDLFKMLAVVAGLVVIFLSMLGGSIWISKPAPNRAQAAAPQRFQYIYRQAGSPNVGVVKDTVTGACWIQFFETSLSTAPEKVCEVK